MIVNKITSAFGDHSSLLPLFTKDIVNSAGMTAFSYNAGGKIEAKDRFIDEFGTQIIWMGGLPFFKYAIDKSVYKMAKMSPSVDVRLLKDKEQLAVAQRFASTLSDKTIADSLNNVAKNANKAKGLFIGKFVSATALTLASFFTLVKAKQHYTKKQIEKEFWAKKSEETFYSTNVAKSPAFKAFSMDNSQTAKNPSKNVSFKGLGSALSSFMFDPVKNLFIVDAGITGERLYNSRTKTEFVETSIKEGGLLFFLYVAGKYVQKGIEKISELGFKKPIDLHAEVLSSEYMHNGIKTGNIYSDIKEFKNAMSSNKALFEYIYDAKNADNTVIKAAKQSKVIKTIVKGNWLQKILGKGVDTNIIDPHQYINPADIEKLVNDIKKIADSSPKDATQLKKFLNSCRNMKVGSVAANMGVTCLFLGLIVPLTMMKYREKQQNGNKEFHVQSEIERQLEKSFKGRIA